MRPRMVVRNTKVDTGKEQGSGVTEVKEESAQEECLDSSILRPQAAEMGMQPARV